MSVPRDHHFIPAFALSPWAISSGDLVEYSLKHGKLIVKSVGPRATGFVRDLYAFPELPAQDAQHLEAAFFNYADNVAAQALELHLTGGITRWTNELISAWSRYVIGIYVRHPDVIPELREASGTIWDKSDQSYQTYYEQVRTPDCPPTMDEWIATVDPIMRAKVQLNCIIKMLDNEIVGTHLNAMRWMVVDVSKSAFRFLMSDRPVQIFRLREPSGFVSIPISPTKLFVAANQSQTLRNLRLTKAKAVVHNVNRYSVSRARKFVWACNETQSRFIEKHMSTAMEPTPFFPNLANYPGAKTVQ